MHSEKHALSLEDVSFCYNVRLTARAIDVAFSAWFEKHEISHGQWFILRALRHRDGITQREISDIVQIKQPSANAAIGELEVRKLVRLVPDPKDRRKVNVRLTARGRKFCTVIEPLADELAARSLADITPEEIATTQSVMRRIRDAFPLR